MKTKFWFALTTLALLVSCEFSTSSSSDSYLNQEQVPLVVRNTFNAKYANRQAQWEKQPYGYEAVFVENGLEHEAEFSENGQWLETEVEVPEQQFSQRVLERVRREHPNYVITKREIEQTPNGTFYEVEIEQGDQEYELYFDAQVNPVRNANEDA